MPPHHPLTPPHLRRGQNKQTSQDVTKAVGSGNVVAYPTESFYALGVDATNPKAIRQLFRAKHRDKNKPVALIAGSMKQVEEFFVLSAAERRLARRHWPGGLTILLNSKKKIAVSALLGQTTPSASDAATPPLGRRGRIRIGVRVPSHAETRAFTLNVGVPITATSANISGQSPTKSAAKVKRDFPGILVVPGRCGQLQKPSTVVEIVKKKIIIHRQGAVYV